MLGPLYLSPQATPPPTQRPTPGRRRRPNRRRRPGRRRPGSRRGQRTRQTRSLEMYGYDYYDYSEYGYGIPPESDYDITTTTIQDYSIAAQNVYFFKRDKYYRVDLQTKHVDYANPPYPRPIAKYWLGCKREETTDDSRAEKR